MSEDLTGDTEVETAGQEGGSARTDTERKLVFLSGFHLLVLARVCVSAWTLC